MTIILVLVTVIALIVGPAMTASPIVELTMASASASVMIVVITLEVSFMRIVKLTVVTLVVIPLIPLGLKLSSF